MSTPEFEAFQQATADAAERLSDPINRTSEIISQTYSDLIQKFQAMITSIPEEQLINSMESIMDIHGTLYFADSMTGTRTLEHPAGLYLTICMDYMHREIARRGSQTAPEMRSEYTREYMLGLEDLSDEEVMLLMELRAEIDNPDWGQAQEIFLEDAQP